MKEDRLSVAVVGLRFGNAFVPLYQRHPRIERVVICDSDPARLQTVGEHFAVPDSDHYASLDAVLADPAIDAVHILTPVRFHAAQVQAVLRAGKHCACAVPMATNLDDLRAIIAAQRETGKNYMMMETAVYTNEFFYARQLRDAGELGNLTFLRGAHIQNIEGLPDYWKGFPPMHYVTHALSPLLSLAQTRAAKVSCFGSGTLRSDLRQIDGGDNPYPLETAIFRLANTDLAAEVTMSFFQTARPYVESFSVYGDRAGFEWQQLGQEEPLVFRLGAADKNTNPYQGSITSERVRPPFRPDLLPPEIAAFADGGHGGSHPHLVHEFVQSVVENRAPMVDAVTAAHWTGAGICAHDSAMQDGALVDIPDFSTW